MLSTNSCNFEYFVFLDINKVFQDRLLELVVTRLENLSQGYINQNKIKKK